MTTLKHEPTIRFDIYMAGDIGQAKQVCREYCIADGFCVHIEPTDFIYTGGEESGFKIGIVNYPRFPSNHDTLRTKALELALMLQTRLCQLSYLVVGPDLTEWFSRRKEDQP